MELEQELEEVMTRNFSLRFMIKENNMDVPLESMDVLDGKDFHDIMKNYENFINKLNSTNGKLHEKLSIKLIELNEWDKAVKAVENKYHQAKYVLAGLKDNEEILQQCVVECRELLIALYEKYHILEKYKLIN